MPVLTSKGGVFSPCRFSQRCSGGLAAWAAWESVAGTGQHLRRVTGRMPKCGSLAERCSLGTERSQPAVFGNVCQQHPPLFRFGNRPGSPNPARGPRLPCLQPISTSDTSPGFTPGKAEQCGKTVPSLRPAPLFPEDHGHPTRVMREWGEALPNQSSHGCRHPGGARRGYVCVCSHVLGSPKLLFPSPCAACRREGQGRERGIFFWFRHRKDFQTL